jgi:hypothetical protein
MSRIALVLGLLGLLSLNACSVGAGAASGRALPSGAVATPNYGRDFSSSPAEARSYQARHVERPVQRAREPYTVHFDCRSCSR